MGRLYAEVRSRDQSEALAVAAEHPGVHVGAVEVREVFDLNSIVAAPIESI